MVSNEVHLAARGVVNSHLSLGSGAEVRSLVQQLLNLLRDNLRINSATSYRENTDFEVCLIASATEVETLRSNAGAVSSAAPVVSLGGRSMIEINIKSPGAS